MGRAYARLLRHASERSLDAAARTGVNTGVDGAGPVSPRAGAAVGLWHPQPNGRSPMFRITMPHAWSPRAIGAVAMAPGAVAAPPARRGPQPAAPDFYTCKALGAGTICTGSSTRSRSRSRSRSSSAAPAPTRSYIHDNGHHRPARDPLVQRRRQPHPARHPRGLEADAYWSNPLTGKTVPYTQTQQAHDGAHCAGRLRLGTRDTGGRERLHRPGDAQEGVAPAPDAWCSGRWRTRCPSRGSSRSSTRSITATCRCSTRVCAALA